MRWMPAAAAAVLFLGAAARGVSEPRAGSQWKYVIVTIPKGSAEIEFDSTGRGKKLKETMLTPTDSLGRDGWELVSVVREENGSYTCFFKQPK